MMDDLRNHKCIVFGGDHYNPLGICRSLGEEGIRVYYVLIGKESTLIKRCKYIKALYYVNSSEEGLTLIMKEFGSETFKPFIFTAADDTTELLDQHYDELKDKFYFFNGGGKGVITKYMNKEEICNVAEKCGIPKPKGEVLKRGEYPKTLRYPIITKVTMSVKGAWKKDVHICQNEEELREAWNLIKADEILCQEYIEKKNELCVDGFSIKGGEEVIFPNTSEYIRFTKDGYGNYMWIKPYNNTEVRKKIHNIIKETNFSGVFSLECLIDKGDNLYFLEVNFRNSTWSYAYTYAGLNLPYQWAMATLNGKIDVKELHIKKEPFKAMAEFNDITNARHDYNIGVWTWLKQAWNCDVLFVYNKRDMAPFLSIVFKSIKQFVSHRLGRMLSFK